MLVQECRTLVKLSRLSKEVRGYIGDDVIVCVFLIKVTPKAVSVGVLAVIDEGELVLGCMIHHMTWSKVQLINRRYSMCWLYTYLLPISCFLSLASSRSLIANSDRGSINGVKFQWYLSSCRCLVDIFLVDRGSYGSCCFYSYLLIALLLSSSSIVACSCRRARSVYLLVFFFRSIFRSRRWSKLSSW